LGLGSPVAAQVLVAPHLALAAQQDDVAARPALEREAVEAELLVAKTVGEVQLEIGRGVPARAGGDDAPDRRGRAKEREAMRELSAGGVPPQIERLVGEPELRAQRGDESLEHGEPQAAAGLGVPRPRPRVMTPPRL
jgi:hypothetical protein